MEAIEKALMLKKELDKLRPINGEQEARIMQKFRLDWNYHSNHLEGNSLTYGETKALLLFGVTAQGKPLRDHFETTGHNEAINMVIDLLEDERPLSENFIREVHKLLLKEPFKVPAIAQNGLPTEKTIIPGTYKTLPNHVRTKTGEIFYFATPEETPAKMNDLLEWYKEKKDSLLNPVLLAAEFHYKFIRIHPFDDGNGRTARILMNFILMQYGYPPIIIKTEDKENYFTALQLADAGQIDPFVEYIANNLNHSLEIMIKGAKGENIDEPNDIDKEIALLDQRLKRFGDKVKISRDKESLRRFHHNSFSKLAMGFLISQEKFSKFYTQQNFELIMNGNTIATSFHDTSMLDAMANAINEDTQNISAIFKFLAFNQKGFEAFNYTSAINVTFKVTSYTIVNSKGQLMFEKYYDEDLSADEISVIITNEAKVHSLFLEKMIEEKESQ